MFLPTDTGPILITGCSSGLGRACALTFQRAGFRTVATARNLAAIEDLRAAGCRTLQLDVADEASRRAAVATVLLASLVHGLLSVPYPASAAVLRPLTATLSKRAT